MKFIIPFLVLLSSFAYASNYNAVTHQLTIDESGVVVAGPRRHPEDPVPYTDPRPGQVGDERDPYRNPDDSPDYQQERQELELAIEQDPDHPWYQDSRYRGVICGSLLAQHARWH